MKQLDSIECVYPLSAMQQGIVFEVMYAPESPVYFQQLVIELEGDLDVDALRRSCRAMGERQPILRTGFMWDDLKEPVQFVQREVDFVIDVYDQNDTSLGGQSDFLSAFLEMDRRRRFNISVPPLLRYSLIRSGARKHNLVISYHHLLFDGWSLTLLLEELLTLYSNHTGISAKVLPEVPSYRSYISWLRNHNLVHAEQLWRKALSDFRPRGTLNIGRPSKLSDDLQTSDGEHTTEMSPEATHSLQAFARHHHLTEGTALQAAWAVALSRYSGCNDVLFGTVTSIRPPEIANIERLVGLCTNLVPVRIRVERKDAIPHWLECIQQQAVELRDSGYVALRQIQDWTGMRHDAPLFEAILTYENYPKLRSGTRLECGLNISQLRLVERPHYPLALTVTPGERLKMRINYHTHRFDADTIASFLEYVVTVIEGITAPLSSDVKCLPEFTDADKQILATLNATDEYVDTHGINWLFSRQVTERPDEVAFVHKTESLTYAELDSSSNKLAAVLKSLGVAAEVPVGVLLERSLDLVIAMMAIYKAGGVYVPLDPSYPETYLGFVIRDARILILVTNNELVSRVTVPNITPVLMESLPLVQISDHAPPALVTEDNLAYIMYTSGSTGEPKGVAVAHKQVLNRLAWMWHALPFVPGDTVCQRTTMNFSVSVAELLGGLLAGVPTIIVPRDVGRNPKRLIEYLSEHEVTRITVVPSLLRMIIEAGVDLATDAPKLRLWTCCGEPLPTELHRLFSEQVPQARLINQYGMSELNDVTWFDTSRADSRGALVTIGRPISNMQLYVVDQEQRLCPVGVAGELFVKSPSPARGYLNKPDLTAEKFVPNPFSTRGGERLCRTGDLARVLREGTVEHLGRIDHQMKIRGQRVELSGIEAVLSHHPAVRECVAESVQGPDGELSISAFVILSGAENPSPSEFRNFLAQRLPAYTVPSRFVCLERMPLMPNGKIDRASLRLQAACPDEGKEFSSPVSSTELSIAKIWATVLNISRISRHDNFFQLGGHSLSAVQTVARLSRALHVDVPLEVLFNSATLADLASELDRMIATETPHARLEVIDSIQRLSDEEVERELQRRIERRA